MRNLISHNPNILGGKPIITGTRMSVESILELLSSGLETKDILREYPFLKKEHIQAAVDFANRLVRKEESYFFEKYRAVANEISR